MRVAKPADPRRDGLGPRIELARQGDRSVARQAWAVAVTIAPAEEEVERQVLRQGRGVEASQNPLC